MISAALLPLLVSGIAMAQAPTGTVTGQVRSEGTGAPLRFAVIEVVTAGRAQLTAVTDSLGNYVVRGVPAGRRMLRVTHFDHAPHEVEIGVAAGREHTLDFALELRPLRLEAVLARTRGMPGAARDTGVVAGTVQGDLGTTGMHVLEATPGVSELGLAEAVREVPGQDPPDPSDILFVRGGAADLKLVLLDGAPVYAPFHIGGLIDALDVTMLRSAWLYLGGAPARYDGGLSYVMDLETRSGRRQESHAVASLDLLSTRAVIEGPIGPRAGYMVGGRALHGLGGEPFVGDPFPYTYGDGLARLEVELGRIGELSATGFWNRESVRLDTLRSHEVAAWGNAAGSVRLRTRLGGTRLLLTSALGSFHTQLPLGGARPLVTDGAVERARLAIDADYVASSLRLQYGASFDRNRYQYRAWAKGTPPDSALLSSVGEGDVTGGYVDVTVQPTPRMLVRAGLRGDIFSLSPAVRLAPRLSSTLLFGTGTAITIAAGRYRQYVRAPSQSLVAIPTGIQDTVSAPPLTIARANHLVVALDQQLGDGMTLGVEGYYKSYEGIPGALGNAAEASGMDLWLRGRNGAIDGWLGYSLAWIWSLDENRARPTNVFAGRHLMSGGIVMPVPAGGVVDVRLGYGAGLPFTAIPETDIPALPGAFAREPAHAVVASLAAAEVPTPPAHPDRPFVRLDARVARTWNTDWRGHEIQVTPYLKILNALNRRDAIFYHYDRGIESPESQAIAAIPLLPIIGVEWRF